MPDPDHPSTYTPFADVGDHGQHQRRLTARDRAVRAVTITAINDDELLSNYEGDENAPIGSYIALLADKATGYQFDNEPDNCARQLTLIGALVHRALTAHYLEKIEQDGLHANHPESK